MKVNFAIFATLFGVILFTGSCTNRVVLEDIQYGESFTIPPLDILFVLDDSPSMRYKLAEVGNTVETFITSYVEGNNGASFKIGVTTTAPEGELKTSVITSDSPISTVKAELRAAIDKIIQDSLTNPNFIEEGLAASASAVYRSFDPGAYFLNQQWYSGDHDLAVIIISDEDDSSVNICHSVESCAAWFQDVKQAYPGVRVSFHAIVDELESCHSNPGSGIKMGAAKYLNMVNATGGKHTRMCDPMVGSEVVIAGGFASLFENVGKHIRSTFPLRALPDLDTLEVHLEGIEQISGSDFEYNRGTNAIQFLDGNYPEHGQHLEISYKKNLGI